MIPTSSFAGLLDETRAARILGLSVKTLRRWRWAGKGPAFRKIGRAVRYATTDLEIFICSALRTSTSDTGKSLPPAIRPTPEPDLVEIVARALRRGPTWRALALAAPGPLKRSRDPDNQTVTT